MEAIKDSIEKKHSTVDFFRQADQLYPVLTAFDVPLYIFSLVLEPFFLSVVSLFYGQVVLASHSQPSTLQQPQQPQQQQQQPPQQQQQQHNGGGQQVALYSSNLSLPSTRGSFRRYAIVYIYLLVIIHFHVHEISTVFLYTKYIVWPMRRHLPFVVIYRRCFIPIYLG